MAEVADFVVIDRNYQEQALGKWESPKFATRGRNILTVDGEERHNAYITFTFRVPAGTPDNHVLIRIIVNDHPLPELVFAIADTMNTTMAAFPASYLIGGGNNVVELHSQKERAFEVTHAIIGFRQNT